MMLIGRLEGSKMKVLTQNLKIQAVVKRITVVIDQDTMTTKPSCLGSTTSLFCKITSFASTWRLITVQLQAGRKQSLMIWITFNRTTWCSGHRLWLSSTYSSQQHRLQTQMRFSLLLRKPFTTISKLRSIGGWRRSRKMRHRQLLVLKALSLRKQPQVYCQQ